MEIINKHQFLISKYPIPMKNLYLYSEDVKDFIEGLRDTAVIMKETYFKDQSEDTIFGQMLLLEMELAELNEKFQQEEDAKQQEDIKSEIESKEKSKRVREQYLRKTIKDNFEEWATARRKSFEIEFLEEQLKPLDERISSLEESIEKNEAKSERLAEDWNYYATTTYGDEISRQEDEIDETINDLQRELEEVRETRQIIKTNLKELGVEI
ncbi:MAG TPA: hypothetical protein DEP51_01095 [Clostridiales bacterium]|nr:hypothetical protein [Clostridiales bacterium]